MSVVESIVPRSSKSEEKLKLFSSSSNAGGPSKWAPLGVPFNVFIVSVFLVTLSITVAVVFRSLYGETQVLRVHGAVLSDSQQCSEIGGRVLSAGGCAVDAAVATVLCLGVTTPHLTSLGGGGFLTVRKGGVPVSNVSINFLDYKSHQAPNTQEWFSTTKEPILVPGVLKGLWTVHQLFGHLPWKQVVRPSVLLAEEGFLVERSLANELRGGWNFQERLIPNSSEAGEGDRLKWPALAHTLSIIANEGEAAFYNGSLADQLLGAIDGAGLGTLERQELAEYQPTVERPLEFSYADYHLLTPSFLTSGGPIVRLSFRLIDHLEQAHSETFNVSKVVDVIEEQVKSSEEFRLQIQNGNVSEETLGHLAELVTQEVSRDTNGTLPVGTVVVVSDSQDVHVAIVTGLGSPFGLQGVKELGISLSGASSWQQHPFSGWLSKMVPVVLMRSGHVCQPGVGGASTTYASLVPRLHAWLHPLAPPQEAEVYSEAVSTAIIMRANSSFRTGSDVNVFVNLV